MQINGTLILLYFIEMLPHMVSFTCFNSLFKLKLTPFGIVHHSKGFPFQVHLTVSTYYSFIKKVILTFLDEVVLKEGTILSHKSR